MAKRPTMTLEVVRNVQLTEHMRRVTIARDALAQLPADQESAYVKLLLHDEQRPRPLIRTYTIRNQRPSEIDIDFVIHSPLGPASRWAVNAQKGDTIEIAGPGPKKLINPHADWFLLAGDLSALPAISVNLSKLPQNSVGYAVIEVPSAADIQSLKHPDNVDVQWEINPSPDHDGNFLASKINALTWLDGKPSVWAACEFNSMRNLRKLFQQKHKIEKDHLYLSSYWKMGQSEEEHKTAKRIDNEQNHSVTPS